MSQGIGELDRLVEDWGIIEFCCSFLWLMVFPEEHRLLSIREMIKVEKKYKYPWDRNFNNLFKRLKKWQNHWNDCSWERISDFQNKSMLSWMRQFVFFWTLFKPIEINKYFDFKCVSLYSTISILFYNVNPKIIFI